jgi:DNA-binding NarL/FixJ family response regulator
VSPTVANPVGRRRRVLVVDDHPLVRESLITLIQRRPDLEVSGEAPDAATALGLIEKKIPHLAIVDLSLPGLSGFELIQELRARCAAVQILVLSMHDGVEQVERAFRAGARGYVLKRESTGQIIDAIYALLRGKTYVSPSLLAGLGESMVDRASGKSGSAAELLSAREMEVFRLLGGGVETKRIAERMNLSIKTVQCYAARVKEKLQLNNASELMREAVRWVDGEKAG